MAQLIDDEKRLVIGISGASGMLYAVRFIMAVPENYHLHIVFSDVAVKVMKMETGWDFRNASFTEYIEKRYGRTITNAALTFHKSQDHFAAIASGSFQVDGMAVVPCSMKTLAGIANGYADTLTERAADVNLKEKRPVVLLVRETPYNRIHLKNMLAVTEAGGTILPASPAFYHHPFSIEDLVDFVVARAFNILKVPHNLVKPWGGKAHG